MRWNVHEDDPKLIGAVLLDGVPVRCVTGFDDADGWVDALCVDGHTGHPGRPHLDPYDESEVCRVRFTGRVEWRPDT